MEDVFLLAVIMAISLLSVVCVALCVFYIIRQIKRQIRLSNSITLIELKANRVFYVVLIILVGLCLAEVSFDVLTGDRLPFDDMRFDSVWVVVALASLVAVGIAFLVLLVVLCFSKCAVVDKGIHTGLQVIDWYNLHDYIIDQVASVVVVSTNRMSYLSLVGTSQPLKVKPEDIPKLVFILNKNKNKFSQKFEN